MRKMINTSHLEGYVYEHKLEFKVTGETSKNPGTEFITGKLSIATDETCMNVVDVHFTYVVAVTKNGKPNATFNILKNIIDGKINTVMGNGIENAGMVRIDSAIALNEWYDQNDQLISVKRNEGGFLHQTNELQEPDKRATFHVDIVITGATRKEADEERNQPEKVIVKGAIFDFRNALMPVEFTVLHPGAMDYFEGLDASNSNPVFTRVQGQQVSQTIVTQKVEESAWGEPMVKETKSSRRDFVINWAQSEPYEWDSEETILASELAEAIQNREIQKAELKKRQDEYRNAKSAPAPTAAPAKGGYNF